MTTASALVALNEDIVNARTAITNKGGTVTSGGGSYQLATDIATIPSGGSAPVITSLSVTPTTSSQTITAPSGTDGYSPVNVAAVTAAIDSNIQAGNIKKDVQILNVTGTYEGSGGGGEIQLTRVKDDTNTEIGTHYMDFTDDNGQRYKVVLLDAQYRGASKQWCSNYNTYVTDLPTYVNLKTSSAWDAKETATFNTKKIKDYCTATGYTSSAVSHCRSKSFYIDGIRYYGQLPNFIEIVNIAKNFNKFDALDTSASSQSSLNFSTARTIWSSTQSGTSSGWRINDSGNVNYGTKNDSKYACPVLEIPY